MKKSMIVLMCAVLALCLAGCGTSAPEPTPSEELNLETLAPIVPTVEEIMEASAADAEAAAEEVPASATDVELDEETFAAAEECIGLTAEELYEAVGKPTGDVNYASSCLEENAEDGMLFYDEFGFYVWTVRNAEGETVHAVYPLD